MYIYVCMYVYILYMYMCIYRVNPARPFLTQTRPLLMRDPPPLVLTGGQATRRRVTGNLANTHTIVGDNSHTLL